MEMFLVSVSLAVAAIPEGCRQLSQLSCTGNEENGAEKRYSQEAACR